MHFFTTPLGMTGIFPLVPKVSEALWEWTLEAKLCFAGRRVSMGIAMEGLAPWGETESRRVRRSQSAALTLGTRGKNHARVFGASG